MKTPLGEPKTGTTHMLLKLAEGVLRLLGPCPPLGQVKAAAAHVQRLKQNKRKKTLCLTFVVEDIRELEKPKTLVFEVDEVCHLVDRRF